MGCARADIFRAHHEAHQGTKGVGRDRADHVKPRYRAFEIVRQVGRVLDMIDAGAQVGIQERQTAQIWAIAGGGNHMPGGKRQHVAVITPCRQEHPFLGMFGFFDLISQQGRYPPVQLAAHEPARRGAKMPAGRFQAQRLRQAAEQARRFAAEETAPARPDAAGRIGDGAQPAGRGGIGGGVILNLWRPRQQTDFGARIRQQGRRVDRRRTSAQHQHILALEAAELAMIETVRHAGQIFQNLGLPGEMADADRQHHARRFQHFAIFQGQQESRAGLVSALTMTSCTSSIGT